MSRRNLAIFAALGATIIYGLNYTIAKEVMPHYVQPFAFILFRVVGAAMLFWIASIFGPKETIEGKDYLRVLGCSILGMGFNMLVFFKGLALSTPINSSVLVTTTPIIVLVLSVIFLKEWISFRSHLAYRLRYHRHHLLHLPLQYFCVDAAKGFHLECLCLRAAVDRNRLCPGHRAG